MKTNLGKFVLHPSSLVLAAALAATAGASLHAATDAEFFGVCEHYLRNHSIAHVRNDHKGLMALAARDGIGWVRTDFEWAQLEPAQGSWNFSGTDAIMDNADARGVKVLPILCYGSAYGGHNSDGNRHVSDDELDGWCIYVSNVVARYKGRLSAVEVWNEEDLSGFWSSTVAQYAKLLQRTYATVKAVDPSVLVVLGGLTSDSSSYLSSLYSAGIKNNCDVIAFHPYIQPHSPTEEWRTGNLFSGYMTHSFSRRIEAIQSVMSSNGDGSKPLWLTEVGWPTAGGNGVSEANQAVYTTNAMAIARSKGVSKYFVYEQVAMEEDSSDAESHFGLLHSDYTFKPAWGAVRDHIYRETHGGATDPLSSRVYLTWGDETAATTSFNAAGHWSDIAAPTSSKDYLVDLGPHDDTALHTPATANATATFPGRSLMLGRVGGRAGNLWHEGDGSTVVIAPLTLNNGRIIPRGGTGSAGQTLAGAVTVASPAAEPYAIEVWTTARDYTVSATLTGAAGTAVRGATSGATGAFLNLSFTGNASGFQGSYLLDGSHVTGTFAPAALACSSGSGSIALKDGATFATTASATLSARSLSATGAAGILDMAAGQTLTLATALSGTFTKTGAGTLVLDGDHLSGAATVNVAAGTVAIDSASAPYLGTVADGATVYYAVKTGDNPEIYVPENNTYILSGQLTAPHFKTGAGTLVLDLDHVGGIGGGIDIAEGTVSCDIDTIRYVSGLTGGTLHYRAEPGAFSSAQTIALFTSEDPVSGTVTWPADAVADGWVASAVVEGTSASIVVARKTVVRVATYNLRCPGDASPNDWRSRVPRIQEVVRRNDFDVFGTEEGVKEQLEAIRTGTGYAYVGVGRDDFADGGEFNAIFYKTNRFAVLGTGTFALSETPDVPGSMSWNDTWPQLATWALFRDANTGRRFCLYGIHLNSATATSSTTVAPVAGSRGARLVLRHALENFAGIPTIVSGDFNAASNWNPCAILSTHFSDATYLSEIPRPASPRVTFHGYGRYTTGGPIDHIFVSEDVAVKRNYVDGDLVDGLYPSDHYPVIADVDIAETSGAVYSADDTFEDCELGGAASYGWCGEGVVAAGAPAVGDPPGLPVPGVAHTKVLAPGEEITRTYDYAFGIGRQSLDMLVQVHRQDGDADWRAEYAAEDAASGAQLRLSFDEEGAPWLHHGEAASGAATWTRLGYSAAAVPSMETFPVFADGQWLRVSFDLDYAASAAAGYAQVRLNGHCLLAPEGLRAPGEPAAGGSWFRLLPAASTARKANAITFVDAVAIDDLVHRYHNPALAPDFAIGSVTSTNGIPFAWFDAAGVPRIPAGDPDGDGFANASEWRKNTDPLDSCSHPPFPTILIAK